jgi:hypothetical protein
VKLADGRLVVTFGYRAEPFTIRADQPIRPDLEQRHHPAPGVID